MRKMANILIVLIMLCVVGCGEKENNKSTNISNEKIVEVVDDFAGVGGYIVQDCVWDYSDRFDNVYEWCDGVKLPIEKFEADEINFIEGISGSGVYAVVEAYGFSEEDFFEYIGKLEKEGFSKGYVDTQALDGYFMYKDNLLLDFMYVNTEEVLRFSVYIRTGNVKENGILDTKEARNIIDESGLIKDNEYFSEYALIEISNETVREKGYVEYYVIAPTEHTHDAEVLPYYIIMKDKEIVFCEQGAASVEYPTNANIIEDEEGQQKLVVSCLEHQPSSSAIPYIGCIKTYMLKDGKFVKDDSVEEIKLDNTYIISIYENGDLKYYTLKENENFDGKKGYSDKWVIDEEYIPAD